MNKELRLKDEIRYYELVLDYLYSAISNDPAYILRHKAYFAKAYASSMHASYPDLFNDSTDWTAIVTRIDGCPWDAHPFMFEDECWFEHGLNSALYYEARMRKALNLYERDYS